jgi:lysophospholipase
MGHVGDFLDYQRDVEQLGEFATEQELPRPYHMMAHSMGGSIGLRALHAGFNVDRVMFSGPMWGIYLPPAVSLLAKLVLAILPPLGFANMLAPTRTLANYVESSPFKGNTLTSDADAYKLMQVQMAKHPELGLGGPSVHWLSEASSECNDLVNDGPTSQPCLTLVGTNERIVDKQSVDNVMARWGNGRLMYFEGAEHEILMESPEIRDLAWAEIENFLDSE